jgi:uncharacterized protein YbaR (Trm112 family)
MTTIDPWYLENLVCPVDGFDLRLDDAFLVSRGDRRYPVIAGVPVMLVDEVRQTIGAARTTLDLARGIRNGATARGGPWYLETLDISVASALPSAPSTARDSLSIQSWPP